MSLTLNISPVSDEYARENFKKIQDESQSNPLLKTPIVVREITFLKAMTNYKYPHGLNFSPKDIILTRITGAGQLTINHSKTDATHLDLSTTDACVVRLMLGTLS